MESTRISHGTNHSLNERQTTIRLSAAPPQKQHVTIAEELNERVSPAATATAAEQGPPPTTTTTTTEHADSSAQTVPQVMVSYDQYPPVEDHAFRTKIDG